MVPLSINTFLPAFFLFVFRRRYSNCLQTLSQFEQSAGSNGKTQHNKAVVAFYAGGCKDYKTFLKALEQDILQVC